MEKSDAPNKSQLNSNLFEGFKISTAGISKESAAKLSTLIRKLGGLDSSIVNEETTCLLVKKVGSTAYQKAIHLKIPTISHVWVSDCCIQKKRLDFDAYHVLPFHGLVVSCTQILPEDRRKLERQITINGGTFSVNLEKQKCTHLIACEAKGEKYISAKTWGTVQIITMQWVKACIEKKRWVPEVDYRIVTKTRKINTVVKNTEERKNESVLKINIVEELNNYINDGNSFKELPSLGSMTLKNTRIFYGNVFFICGIKDKKIHDYLIGCVLSGGGHCSCTLSNFVTHVVVGSEIDQGMLCELRDHPCSVDYINMLWILEKLFGMKKLLHSIINFKLLTGLDKRKIENTRDLVSQYEEYETKIQNNTGLINNAEKNKDQKSLTSIKKTISIEKKRGLSFLTSSMEESQNVGFSDNISSFPPPIMINSKAKRSKGPLKLSLNEKSDGKSWEIRKKNIENSDFHEDSQFVHYPETF